MNLESALKELEKKSVGSYKKGYFIDCDLLELFIDEREKWGICKGQEDNKILASKLEEARRLRKESVDNVWNGNYSVTRLNELWGKADAIENEVIKLLKGNATAQT